MRLAVLASNPLGIGFAWFLVLASGCTSDPPDAAPVIDGGAKDERVSEDGGDASEASAPRPFPLGQVCPPVTDPSLDACRTCSRASCCDTARIRDTEEGNELIACLQAPGCGAPSCQEICFQRFPSQTGLFLEHLACLEHLCASPCESPPTKCAECLDTNCLNEALACDLSRECFLLTGCVARCDGKEACQTACANRYEGARAIQGALLVCASNQCGSECGTK